MHKIKRIMFAVLAGVILFLSGCTADPHVGQKSVELYYTNQAHDSLVSQIGYVPEKSFGNVEDKVRAVLTELFRPVSSEQCVSVIPHGLTLRGVSMSDSDQGTINVDINGDYYGKLGMSDYSSDELLARYSIICTLCQFEEIKKVKIFINREDLKSNYGEGSIIPPMGRDSVLMNSPSSVETQTEKICYIVFYR